jgi:hypothetical protein
MNNFRNSKSYCFLLDNENKVTVIGNPIYNPKIRDLYMSIITGHKRPSKDATKPLTTVALKSAMHNFESFPWKTPQQAIFILQNAGHTPLIIEGASTSCGCTTVEYPKQPVQPGDSIALTVTYKADRPEHFDKSITVYCNAKGSPFKLRIKGNAE